MAIVINGIGKCGTTLLYNFFSKYHGRGPFIRDLSNIKGNIVYKTHTPIPNAPKNAKVLYMFGDVYNTIVSFYSSWMKHGSHGRPNKGVLKNMLVKNANGTPFEVKTFDFKKWLDNWYKPQGFPVMFVRYEKMHKNARRIMSFCGLNNQPTSIFPQYKKRKTDWNTCNEEQKIKLQEFYGEAYNFVNTLPDITVFK